MATVNIRYRVDATRALAQMRRIDTGMRTLSNRVTATGGAFVGATAAAAAFTAAIAALGTAVSQGVQLTTELEHQLATIAGLVGISTDQLREWSTDLVEISRLTGRSQQELAQALYFITSAGLRGTNAIEALESAARASAAGLGDMSVVADVLTSAMNAYGPEVLSAAQATDELIKAIELGKLLPAEFAQSIGFAIPVASQMGVTFQELVGLMAAMSRTGTNASTATVQIRQAMFQLLKPSVDAAEALREVGLSVHEVQARIAEQGLFRTLIQLRDAFEAADVPLARLFPNIRAFAGVLDLLGENLEENVKLMEDMGDAAGKANEAFEAIDETIRQRANVALVEMHNVLIGVGTALEGLDGELLDAFAISARRFGEALDGALADARPFYEFMSRIPGTSFGWIEGIRDDARDARDALRELRIAGSGVLDFSIVDSAVLSFGDLKREIRESRDRLRELTDEEGLPPANPRVVRAQEELNGLLHERDVLLIRVAEAADKAAAAEQREREEAERLAEQRRAEHAQFLREQAERLRLKKEEEELEKRLERQRRQALRLEIRGLEARIQLQREAAADEEAIRQSVLAREEETHRFLLRGAKAQAEEIQRIQEVSLARARETADEVAGHVLRVSDLIFRSEQTWSEAVDRFFSNLGRHLVDEVTRAFIIQLIAGGTRAELPPETIPFAELPDLADIS